MESYNTSPVLTAFLTMTLIGGCFKELELKENRQKLEQKTLESKVERIAIQEGVQAYTVNAAGKTNYFKYNGSFYAPMTNEVIKTTN